MYPNSKRVVVCVHNVNNGVVKMIIKNIIIGKKKVKLQTTNTETGKVHTYPLGKTKVFTEVKTTKGGFKAKGIARDGNVATIEFSINHKGKMVGVTIDHPKTKMVIRKKK